MGKFKRRTTIKTSLDESSFGETWENKTVQAHHYRSILALDVGFAKTGWAIFQNHKPVECGLITNPKSKQKNILVANEYVTRAGFLARSIKSLIEDYHITCIVGELPSGGSQNASAMAKMSMATAIMGSVVTLLGIPAEWCTPADVKIATCGTTTATKPDMMNRIGLMFGYSPTTSKMVNCKRSANFPKGQREEFTYYLCNQQFGVGAFEHIADACGAYLALQDGNLVKMLARD